MTGDERIEALARPMIRRALVLVAVLVGSIASVALLRFPVAPLLSLWGLSCLVFAYDSPTSNRKAIWFNVAIVLLVLAIADAVLQKKIKYQVGDCEKAVQQSEQLGWAPMGNFEGRCKGYRGSVEFYDYKFSTNRHGMRISPPYQEHEVAGCVLFFGGSFTWGSGIDDEEVIHHRVGVRSGGRFRTHNFAFGGYGTHQMLAAIEHGLVAERIDCRPTHVVYLAIFDHVRRVAGIGDWAWTGPHYVLREDGGVRYVGQFADEHSSIARELYKIGKYRSGIASRLLNRRDPVSQEEIDLFTAVMKATRDLLETEFPGTEFHVLHWEKEKEYDDLLLDALETIDTTVHSMAEALQNEGGKDSIYRLHRYDGHPNALAHDRMAEYVLAEILGDSDGSL